MHLPAQDVVARKPKDVFPPGHNRQVLNVRHAVCELLALSGWQLMSESSRRTTRKGGRTGGHEEHQERQHVEGTQDKKEDRTIVSQRGVVFFVEPSD